MAVKTITIDVDAYDRLKACKRGNESFSDVLKRIAPKPVDLDALFKKLDKNPLSDHVAATIEQYVDKRRKLPRRRGR